MAQVRQEAEELEQFAAEQDEAVAIVQARMRGSKVKLLLNVHPHSL